MRGQIDKEMMYWWQAMVCVKLALTKNLNLNLNQLKTQASPT